MGLDCASVVTAPVCPFIPMDVPRSDLPTRRQHPGARPLLPASTSGTAQQLTNHQTHLVSAPFNLPTNDRQPDPCCLPRRLDLLPRPSPSLFPRNPVSTFRLPTRRHHTPEPEPEPFYCLPRPLAPQLTTTNHTYLCPAPVPRANPCVDRAP